MDPVSDRRHFLQDASLGAAGLLAASQVASGAQPTSKSESEPEGHESHDHAAHAAAVGSKSDRGKLVPGRRRTSDPLAPVETPDVSTLPHKVVKGVKEFHLTAEHVEREILPDKVFDVWGYNGEMPGPTIVANEGDRVRFVVHNKLPEPTTIHWHGIELPIAMDGVEHVTQDLIMPGKSFAYEFTLHQSGTFFYHSHGAMQQSIGMAGIFIIHPRQKVEPAVDRDIAYVLQEFAVLPKSTVPDTISEAFNIFTLNGRAGPTTAPVVVRLGDRVRLRFVNVSTMDHHPMHLHGHTFWVTGGEAGRIPESAWIPGNTVLVGVGQSRDVEFIANNPGDWVLHCHIPHHMMNHMVPMLTPRMSGMASVSTGSVSTGSGHQHHGDPDTDPRFRVPGYPQDMMDGPSMFTEEQIQRFSGPLTRGLRTDWHKSVMGMMTVLRVVPPELYDRLVSSDKPLPPGVNVPGAAKSQKHDEHHDH